MPTSNTSAPKSSRRISRQICTLYPNFAALDCNKGDDDKADAIAAAHFATADEDKQQEMIKPRLDMRTYLGTTYAREVTLCPAE